MKPEHGPTDRAAIHSTGAIATPSSPATGAKPHTTEAELWYAALDGEAVGRWTYFRRYASAQAGEAAQRVEADFTQWIDGRLEAGNADE